jgi:tetratricopeptide (TPR) repeat protein
MIGLLLKIVLTLGSLGYASYLFADGYWGWGIVVVLAAALIAFTIYRNENIILALNQMRLGNQEKAKKMLMRIKQPQFLIKRQQAYFYYLKAQMFSQELGLSESEKMFNKSLGLGLKNDQDKAVVKLNLSAISMQKGKKREALNFLNEAKKLDTGNLLNDQIKMIKGQLGKVGSANQMRMAHMNKGRGGRMR